MDWIKEQLIFFGLIMVATFPMFMFLDYGMGISLKDYGLLKTAGFIVCMVFYGIIYAKCISKRL